MKRILYLSHYSYDWQVDELQNLADVAATKNRELSITGILITFDLLFFQIIEGPENNINNLFKKICKDNRHCEISIIQCEENVQTRLFEDWHMKIFNLDSNPDALEYSIKILLRSLIKTYKIIGRYNHSGILRKIKAGINPAEIAPRRVKKIVMFADIVGFSKISEENPIEKVVEIISRFFENVTLAVENQNGEVEKFIGDCVMASFSATNPAKAINAVIDILRRTSEIFIPASAGGSAQKISCGIGMAIGSTIEGNVGSGTRMDYTILGDVVNTAQRLEQLTRSLPFSLAITSELKDAIAEDFTCVKMGTYDLKGKQNSVEIFSVDLPETRKPTA